MMTVVQAILIMWNCNPKVLLQFAKKKKKKYTFWLGL